MDDLETLARSTFFRREGGNLPLNSFPEPKVIKELPAGTIIESKYRILSLLGKGGMGTVYQAYHQGLGKTVALKTIQTETADSITADRFKREARTLASFTNPYVVQIFDFGVDENKHPYFTMELLEGRPLDEYIHSLKRLPIDTACHIMMQVASALAAAHKNNIIHRDLKPANIFLKTQEQGFQVKIVDFGIAKLIQGDSNQELSDSGIIFGSPLYMSPEQGLGKDTDSRTDIYSFGCTFFEALTGQPPFRGKNAFETVFKHVEVKAPRLHDCAPSTDFPDWLETLIGRLLKKDPAERVSSMQEVVDILQYNLTKKISSKPKEYQPQTSNPGEVQLTSEAKPPIRAQSTAITGALVVFAGIAAVAVMINYFGHSPISGRANETGAESSSGTAIEVAKERAGTKSNTISDNAGEAPESGQYNKSNIEVNEIRNACRIFSLTENDAAYINSHKFSGLFFDRFNSNFPAFDKVDLSNVAKLKFLRCRLDKKTWQKALTAPRVNDLELEDLQVEGENTNQIIADLKQFKNLASLSVNYFRDADDNTVAALLKLQQPGLKRICLSHDEGISAGGLARLAEHNWQHIELNFSNLDDQSFLKISRCNRDLFMEIRGTKVTAGAIDSALKSGHIQELKASADTAEQQAALNKLRARYPRQISGEKNLQDVASLLENGNQDTDVASLLDRAVADDNLVFKGKANGTYGKILDLKTADEVSLINSKHCNELAFADFKLSSALFNQINLNAVTTLNFFGTHLNESIWKHVRSCRSLQELSLDNVNLPSTEIKSVVSQLKYFPALTFISLDTNDLDDEIIDIILSLPNKDLKRVSLSGNQRLSSSALVRLKARPWYRMDLSFTNLDDHGFKELAKAGENINFDIRGTNVTAKALQEVLSHPNSVDSVKAAVGKGITAGDMESLVRSYPQKIISRD